MDSQNIKEEPADVTDDSTDSEDDITNCISVKIERLDESNDLMENMVTPEVSYNTITETEFPDDFCHQTMNTYPGEGDGSSFQVKTEPEESVSPVIAAGSAMIEQMNMYYDLMSAKSEAAEHGSIHLRKSNAFNENSEKTPMVSVEVEPMGAEALGVKANPVDICSMYLEVQLSEGAIERAQKEASVDEKSSNVKKNKKRKSGGVEPIRITRLPLDAFANVHIKKRNDKPAKPQLDANGKPIKTHLCEVCKKTFSKKNGLNEHMLIHTGVKPHRCDICFNTFRLKSNLSRHLVTHTGNKQHFCEICSRKFTQKSDLTIHMYVHTGHKPYKCEICSKCFSQHSSLSRHLSIHTGQKPFECQICSKKFRKKCGLSNHSLTHLEHKPFTCDICSKSFTQKGGLQTHMFTHTGQKPYHCHLCNKGFITNGILTRHMLTVHTSE